MERRKDNKGRVLQKGESQRKDGLYVYQYKDISGKRKSVYAKNLSDLRKQEKQIQRDMEDGIDSYGGEITLNEQFEKYMSLKNQLKNATILCYTSLWNSRVRGSAIGNKKVRDIKKSDMMYFYNNLHKNGLKKSTIFLLNTILSPCFELAVEDNIIRKNPCVGCMKDFKNDAKERIPLNVQEQRVILNYAKEKNFNKYLLIAFMIGTAVRCGEAIGLTWSNVDFKSKEIRIDHQLIYKKMNGEYKFYISSTKNSKPRSIPMTTDVYNILLEQRKHQLSTGSRTNVEIDGYSDFVFSTRKRTPIIPWSVNDSLNRIVNSYNKMESKELELPHISAHVLRHTGCTRMAEAGIDVKVLQSIMGHSNIAVTMEIYNHATSERSKKEIEKMEKIKLMA